MRRSGVMPVGKVIAGFSYKLPAPTKGSGDGQHDSETAAAHSQLRGFYGWAEPLAVILILIETLGGLCIALRGGGPYSLDRKLSREL